MSEPGYWGNSVLDEILSDEQNYVGGNTLLNGLLATLEDQFPKEYNIRHNGRIVQGTLGNVTMYDILNLRKQIPAKQFMMEYWEAIIAGTENDFIYCPDNKKIYKGIPSHVADYLDSMQASYRIYKMIANKEPLPNTKGNSVEVYKSFLANEKKIHEMRDMLSSTTELDTSDKDFEFKYIRDLVHAPDSDKPKKNLSGNIERKLEMDSQYYDICAGDLTYRHMYGMKYDDAKEAGIEDREKYGIKYIRLGNSFSNFCSYLDHVARRMEQET